MRKRAMLAGAALAAAAAASLFAVTLASAGKSPRTSTGRWLVAPGMVQGAPEDTALGEGGEILALIENESQGQNAFIDVGDPGFSPGDYSVFRDPLYNADQSQLVGHVNVHCEAHFTRALCHGTAELAGRGKISFEGTAPDQLFLLAITGGTSEFTTVRGQVRIQVGVPSDGLDTLTLQLFND